MSVLTIKRGDLEKLKATEVTLQVFASGLRFMAKKSLTDADAAAVIDKSIGTGIVITVAGSVSIPAEAEITINPADTKVLPNRSSPQVKLFYDLIDSANHSLDSGTLIVTPEVIVA